MKKVSLALFVLIVTLGLVFSGVSLNANVQSDNQLVQKLTELFRGVDNVSIDDAVTKAKSQLSDETNQARRNNLEQLFNSQIATLEDRGVPEQILSKLRSEKKVVVDRAGEMTIGVRNIPFIPVIKPSYLGYCGLAALMRNEANEGGRSYLNPTCITDKVETPDDLYYIYDVEDGEATCGQSPEAAEKVLKQQKRSPLTVAEAMALATHTSVLSRHFVDASGSRYQSSVPDVYLDGGTRPGLDWGHIGSSDNHWGSASCGSRY